MFGNIMWVMWLRDKLHYFVEMFNHNFTDPNEASIKQADKN